MKTLSSLTGVIAWLALGACYGNDEPSNEQDSTASPAQDQVTDLSAWRRVGDDPWTLTGDGAVAGPAEATGFIVSPEPYGDFRLTLEYRIEDATNSGVFLRCLSASEISPDACYEVNIWDNHAKPASRTGSIVQFVEPAARFDGLGRWVTIDIQARGDLIVVTFDGDETARLRDTRSHAGPVALQYGGTGELRFRNVRIERL